MQGITHGACDYLLKPVRIEELKIIWKHVIKKSYQILKKGQSDRVKDSRTDILKIGGIWLVPKRKRDQVDEHSGNEDVKQKKWKSRVNWSKEMHAKFVYIANQVGMDSKYR